MSAKVLIFCAPKTCSLVEKFGDSLEGSQLLVEASEKKSFMEGYFRNLVGGHVARYDIPPEGIKGVILHVLNQDGMSTMLSVVGSIGKSTSAWVDGKPVDLNRIYELFMKNADREEVVEVETINTRNLQRAYNSSCGLKNWIASVQLKLKWRNHRITLGDMKTDKCIGFWPPEVPFVIDDASSI